MVIKNSLLPVLAEMPFNTQNFPANDACGGKGQSPGSAVEYHQAKSQADRQGGDLVHAHGILEIGLAGVPADL